MAGYIRQSTFVDGDTITAALFNNEYNQLVNAFSNTSGHKHDGTTAEGPVIGLIGDAGETSPNNKVLIDTTNNYIEFYVEVSSAPVQQLYIADGAIIPVTDSDIDLGTTSLRFKDTYTDTVTTTGNVSIGGDLTVTGSATISGNLTFGDADTDSINLAAEIDSDIIPNTDGTYDLGSATKEWQDLYIDGTANIDSLVADTADINGGTIDGATIATSNITVGSGKTLDVSSGTLTLADDQISGDKVEGGTIAATTVTTLTSTTGNITNVNATTVDSTNLEVTNLKAKDGTSAGSIADSTGVVTLASSVLTTTDINGGTIDGTTIATSDITVGTGKTLDVSSGTLTLADNQISGDKVEGGTIAATTITDLTFGSLNDGTITVTAFADEDDMSSDSATLVPTQQSVKAYVDSQVTAQDLDFQGDSGGALSIDLDSESLTIAGGTGIDTSGVTNTLTVAIDSTVATLTDTQTLTNKTLTTPVISSISNTGTLTLPTSTDTLVGRATTDTLTNKTLTSPVINTGVSGTAILDEDNMASDSATQLATQQSIKAYVDAQVGGVGGGDVVDDTTPQLGGNLDLNSNNITGTGDINITGTVTADGLTVDGVGSIGTTGGDLNIFSSTSGHTGLRFAGNTILPTDNAGNASDNTVDLGNVTGTNYRFKDLYLSGNITGTLATAAQPNITSVGTLTGLTTSGDINLGDNDKAIFGAGSDLQIYHDGSHSIITDQGTGSLLLRGTAGVFIQNAEGTENIIAASADGAVTLYYDNGAKIATTSTGIDVTGTVVADGITSSGNINLDLATPTVIFKESGAAKFFIGESSAVGGGSGFYDMYAAAGLGQRFFTGAAERMRIDSSGNVGIGTTSPTDIVSITRSDGTSYDASALQAGGARLSIFNSNNTTSDTFADIHFKCHSTSSGEARIGMELPSVANSDLFFITESSSTLSEKMRITSSGNVGIGTDSPANLLQVDVNSASTTTDSISVQNSGASSVGHTTGLRFQFNAAVPSAIRSRVTNATTGAGTLGFFTSADGTAVNLTERMTIDNAGAVSIAGSLSKGSGSFKIDHPLESKTDTHHLVHSFVEAPKADNIYRGKVDLVDGSATVNIDNIAGMTEGTFVALNTDVQCFTTNESDWDAVKGSVSGNILTISCQNTSSTATVSWLVIGERQDQHMLDTEWTDENGKVIVEPLKIVEPLEEETE